MPKGVAKDPGNDGRRNNTGTGRKPTLPPNTHVWHVRVTYTEREALAIHLATIRAAWARKRAGQAEETKETEEDDRWIDSNL